MTKEELEMDIAENHICAEVGKTLESHYPGYDWWVECKIPSGLVSVRNMNIDGEFGFVIHLARLVHDNDLKVVVDAGGEILERCNLPRGPKPEVLTGLERGLRGDVINTDKEVFGGLH